MQRTAESKACMARLVSVANRSRRFRVPRKGIIELIRALDRGPLPSVASGEMSIALLDNPEMIALHNRFLGQTDSTDVITFPGDPEMDFAGEICVSLEQAAVMATALSRNQADELALYLVHGWLHLAGLEDKEAYDREQMRRYEQRALAHAKEAGICLTVSACHPKCDSGTRAERELSQNPRFISQSQSS